MWVKYLAGICCFGMDWKTYAIFGITVIVILITRIIFIAYRKRRTLHWVPEVPGVPVLGNVLQVCNSTVTLKEFGNFLDQFSGFCRVNFIYDISILTSDPTFLEFVLSSNKIVDKSTEYKFLWNWLGWGLLTAPGGRWKKNRKIITPAFHFSILEQFIDVFETNGQILIDLLGNELNKIFNIHPFVTMCTLDVISEAAMGVPINAQKNIHSEYVFCVKEMCRITIDRSFSLKRYDLLYQLSRDCYNEKKYVKVLHGMTNSVIKSRKEQRQIEKQQQVLNEGETPKRLAFLDLLLKAQMEGQDIADDVIREEVDTFMFEGHDTTTSAICFVLYCLANHPEYQARAFEEQKAIFGSDKNRKNTFRNLQEMKFLELVIKETLRLYPSVPYYARHVDQDIQYKDGKIIPKGVNIIIVAFKANRNPKVFENPNVFNPYRFESMESKQWHYSYIPFSAGPRNCIGQKFAMLELKSIVSKILRNYEVHSGGPENEVVLVAEAVLSSKNGVNLNLTRRQW